MSGWFYWTIAQCQCPVVKIREEGLVTKFLLTNLVDFLTILNRYKKVSFLYLFILIIIKAHLRNI